MSSKIRTRTRSQRSRKTEIHPVQEKSTTANSKSRRKADNENSQATKTTNRLARRDQKLTDLTNQETVSIAIARKSRSRVRTLSNREKHRNQSKTKEDVDRKRARRTVSTKENETELRNCSVNLLDISTTNLYFDKDKAMVSKIKKPLLKDSQEDSLITRMIKKRKTTKESKNTSGKTEVDPKPSTSKIVADATELKMKPSRLRKPTPSYAEYTKQLQSKKRNLAISQETPTEGKLQKSSQLLNTTRTRSLSPQPIEKTPAKVTLRSKSRPDLERHKNSSIVVEKALNPEVLITNTAKGKRGRPPKKTQEETKTPQQLLENSSMRVGRTRSKSFCIEKHNEVDVKSRSKSRVDTNRKLKGSNEERLKSVQKASEPSIPISINSKRGGVRKNLEDPQQEKMPANAEESTISAQAEIVTNSVKRARGRPAKAAKVPETPQTNVEIIKSLTPQIKLPESTQNDNVTMRKQRSPIEETESPKLREFSIILERTPISKRGRPRKDAENEKFSDLKVPESTKIPISNSTVRKRGRQPKPKVVSNVESSDLKTQEFLELDSENSRNEAENVKESDLKLPESTKITISNSSVRKRGRQPKVASNVKNSDKKVQESSELPITHSVSGKRGRPPKDKGSALLRKEVPSKETTNNNVQNPNPQISSELLIVDADNQQVSKQIDSAEKEKISTETSQDQSKELPKKSSLVRQSMKRRMSVYSCDPEVKQAVKKRVVIQSPPKGLSYKIPREYPFKKLIEIEEEEAEEDVYNFRMSQAAYPKNMKRKKAQPVRRNKKKTNAGSKIDNLIQRNNLNIVSNSCTVMHNPSLFKAEKAKVMQSLNPNPKHIQKVNVEVDIAKEIKLPQRKSLNHSVNTTKSRTPPKNVHRRLNMSSPDPDMNNDEILPELPPVPENLLNVPRNPIVNKIMENTKRASLVFSPKIVSSPKIVNSPFRINDEIKFPRTFYFSLTKDNLPSFSSDHVMKELDENDKKQNNRKETSKASENPPKSTETSTNSDFYFTPPQIVEESVLNNSDMENIAPQLPPKKTPKKKGALENPTRSPLKALEITENMSVSHVQSPLAIYSASATVDQRKNIVILGNELLKDAEPGPSNAHSKISNITEDLSENSVRVPTEIPKNYSSLPENDEKFSANNENVENPKINSKTFAKRPETPSSDAEDDFGFDDLINESVHEETGKNPSSDLSFSAIKQKLSSLKQYLPSKLKNTSNEKIVAPSPLKATRLFASPKKVVTDIREMFTSTPHQGAEGLFKKKISFDVESTRRSNLLSTTEATVANDETGKENTETSTQIELFDDPNLTTDASQIYRSYTRKRRFDFLDVTDGNISDLDEEEAERPKKKRKKPNVENTKEFKKFVSEMNSAFEEVDNYDMVVE